jgi:DNA-binding MarR family transcriptional regulator
MLALVRTADVVRRSFTTVFEPHGITAQQYNVLRILRGSGADGLPTLEVAERMLEQTPGITRLMDRLEAKELVRRQRCPKDRRQHLCWITPKGLALLASLDEPIVRAHAETMRKVKIRDLDTLIQLLEKVRAAHQ